MTNVYFVRHAQANNAITDDMTRPLSEKGLQDRALVSAYLEQKAISAVFSSPYKRAYDTVFTFAARHSIEIVCSDDFRERRITDGWIADYDSYAKQQWLDFSYKLPGGESLYDVQTRNVNALYRLLPAYPEKNIAIATHGTALSTIINYFDKTFTYRSFLGIINLMPWIVHFQFDGERCVFIDSINHFEI